MRHVLRDSRGAGVIAAVVLAAGASTRMGRPKALLRHGERSFVACAVELAAAAGCAPIVVVVGA
ncbi:MAG: NTP transferase domain-containing protein, partial [Myxococcales bacterium]|nr:NTP transferase domain-containing protein [Myxococcales bacterium]